MNEWCFGASGRAQTLAAVQSRDPSGRGQRLPGWAILPARWVAGDSEEGAQSQTIWPPEWGQQCTPPLRALGRQHSPWNALGSKCNNPGFWPGAESGVCTQQGDLRSRSLSLVVCEVAGVDQVSFGTRAVLPRSLRLGLPSVPSP